MTVESLLPILVRWLSATLLLTAALTKLLSPKPFLRATARLFGRRATSAVLPSVILLEGVTAGALLWWPKELAHFAGGLLFCIFAVLQFHPALVGGCGCFGQESGLERKRRRGPAVAWRASLGLGLFLTADSPLDLALRVRSIGTVLVLMAVLTAAAALRAGSRTAHLRHRGGERSLQSPNMTRRSLLRGGVAVSFLALANILLRIQPALAGDPIVTGSCRGLFCNPSAAECPIANPPCACSSVQGDLLYRCRN